MIFWKDEAMHQILQIFLTLKTNQKKKEEGDYNKRL